MWKTNAGHTLIKANILRTNRRSCEEVQTKEGRQRDNWKEKGNLLNVPCHQTTEYSLSSSQLLNPFLTGKEAHQLGSCLARGQRYSNSHIF
ncbi:Matrix Metalloproteinase-20 [Manis pentadactyla]|nr:Matrix Metalloproteinase-20 [Manis pentadactyla]